MKFWRAIGVAALCSVILSAAGFGDALAKRTGSGAANYYEDAHARYDRGDFAGAIVQLKNALRRAPGDLPARILFGRANLRLGDAATAEKALLRARSEGADEELLIVPLAKAMMMLKRYSDVLANSPVEGHQPDVEAELRIVRGRAFLALRDLEPAAAAFRRAAELRPATAAPMIGLARVYLARADLEAARRKARQALAAEPENFLAWFMDGQVAWRRGDRRAALESFDKSIALAPEHVATRLARVMSLIDLGRLEEASGDLAFLRRRIPQNPFTAFADALIKAGRKDGGGYRLALARADTLIRAMEPDALSRDPPMLFLAGIVNFGLGNDNDAYNFLREHLRRNPSHAGTRSILGRLLLRRGEVRSALRTLRGAVKLTPGDADLWRLVGIAYMRNGRHEEASKAFKEAIALKPREMTLRTVLAMNRLQSGRKDEAVAGLEEALENEPDAIRPGLMLAMVLLRDRDYDGTLRVLRKIIARDPDNPVLYNVLASAQWATGATAAARENLHRAIALDPNYLAAHRSLAQIDSRTGSRDAAKARYQSMLTMPGAGARPLIDLAKIAAREGRLGEAISLLSKARKKKPKNLRVQFDLIDLYARVGDRDAALRNARKLRDRLPDNAAVMEKLGRAELASGNPQQAAAAFRRLSNLVSDDADRLLRVARLLIRASDRQSAHDALKRALVQDSGHLGVLEEIVKLESDLGLFDDALLRIKLAIRRYPKLAIGDRLRGDVLTRRREFEKAAASYGAALRKQPSGSLLARQYLARRAAGGAAPLEPLEKWVEANPKDYAARHALAAAYGNAGRAAAAIGAYEALAVDRPEDPVVLNNLAWLYFEAGDGRALETAEKAYRLAPKRTETLDTLGWILVQTGETARGLELLRDAFARSSRRPAVRYHLAVVLTRRGQVEEAREHLEAILEEAENVGADVARKSRALLATLKDD